MKQLNIDEPQKISYCVSTELRDEQIKINLKKVKGRFMPVDGMMTEPIAIVCFGPSLKDEWEKVFDFAKDMGMEYISAEPEPDDWDLVEELAIKNKIKVAVHNHPSESSYWNPDILLGSIQHRVNSIGACLDVGHYKRMGVEPLPAIKKLKGRIVSIHMKDILAREDGSKYDDVVWGNGELGIREILEELKRQNFKGYFTIEYEASWNNNIPEIEKSIEYFNKISDIIL